MLATVMIPTVERTALDYLIGPLVMSFNHVFRQRQDRRLRERGRGAIARALLAGC